MSKPKRKNKSFTLEGSIVSYVSETQGSASASERVNKLLRRAIIEERYEALEREAAEFFAEETQKESGERAAFRRATLKSLSRE